MSDSAEPDPTFRRLCWLAAASLPIYLAICGLSFRFDPEGVEAERPIVAVVSLFAIATLLYFLALFFVLREEWEQPRRLRLILAFAVLSRLILLPSLPIQEIDYYRYLWDGQVLNHGQNPYRFSPIQVEQALDDGDALPADLQTLGTLARRSPALTTIFERVHHRLVPTVYPPVAQAVFAAAARLTPVDAPVWVHVIVLKLLFLGFDLGGLGLLVLLLRVAGKPSCWCLAYGWCPLVLKEVENSAHVDVVAVFFSVLAMYLLLAGKSSLPRAVVAMVVLALAILAKSYPVILLPILAGSLAAKLRFWAVLPLASCVIAVLAGYAPFVADSTPPDDADAGLVPLQPHHPASGLSTFLTRWQVNDFLFMLVNENLRWPSDDATGHWFVIVPASWRAAAHRDMHATFPQLEASGADPGFVLAKLLMGAVLGALGLFWAWRVYTRPELLLRGVFLMLAWGWLLSSTQNPWYLLWCLPFMVFARQRSWFLLTALVLIYYLRFWLEYQAPPGETGLADAQALFDYRLIWLEYVPFFAALVLETWWTRGTSE